MAFQEPSETEVDRLLRDERIDPRSQNANGRR